MSNLSRFVWPYQCSVFKICMHFNNMLARASSDMAHCSYPRTSGGNDERTIEERGACRPIPETFDASGMTCSFY